MIKRRIIHRRAPKTKRLSVTLRWLQIRLKHQTNVTLENYIYFLGERGYGPLILLFSLPNSLPVPSLPGYSTLFSLPIILLSLQMIAGRTEIWLPRRFRQHPKMGEWLTKAVVKATPWLIKWEWLIHSRWYFLPPMVVTRLVGLVILAMALVLLLPIPFGNFLPGLAISFLALGLWARDGVLMALGLMMAGFMMWLLVSSGNLLWQWVLNF